MRLRNIKDASSIIMKSPYVISNCESYKGKFNELFKNNNIIQIEIGMGKGDFIIEKARQNPNINFIGIEKYATVLVSVVKKLEAINLNNLKIMHLDALMIDEVFHNEIDTIYLNFSDPWPKKRHINRRLTSPVFLTKYDCLFKNNGQIEMKTDNQNLFEYSLVTLNQNDYVLEEISLNLYNDLPISNIPTEYEKKFSAKGMPIYKLKALKIRQTIDTK
ncbi:MAG: tRNA (guanosine(46)-N7)-methyltransferase TrmB [Bacilli bacterium]